MNSPFYQSLIKRESKGNTKSSLMSFTRVKLKLNKYASIGHQWMQIFNGSSFTQPDNIHPSIISWNSNINIRIIWLSIEVNHKCLTNNLSQNRVAWRTKSYYIKWAKNKREVDRCILELFSVTERTTEKLWRRWQAR